MCVGNLLANLASEIVLNYINRGCWKISNPYINFVKMLLKKINK